LALLRFENSQRGYRNRVVDATAKTRRLRLVRQELARATARRTELWYEQGGGGAECPAVEVERLSKRIDALWTEARVLEAEIRHGARADIIARARQAERIERDLTRRAHVAPAGVLSR
jgi:hypothetical protein